jgi:very-short-patch-repair endonuclease
MSGEEGTSAMPSFSLGKGRDGVRRESAVRSAREALSRLPPVEPQPRQEGSRPWGRPEAATTVETARALRKHMTPQEAKIWLRLRALHPQGFHFRRQVPIARFIVDFACLKARLVVEIDGGQHGFDAHSARDIARDTKLSRLGYRVVRFWNAEVDADPDAIVETILARLNENPE